MTALPEGTVTFLFTDIEGSTRKWEQHADAMRVALRRHDGLLRAVIAQHRGYVFKTVGDAFHAAFQRPAEAVAASLAVQQALAAERWSVPDGLRVRIALHTGVAESRDGDYFGPTVNRTARLLSAGHGGQVLLFRSTYDLAREMLPQGVSVRDLGLHRLKDLAGPEQIYQLVVPELPADFPPLVSLEAFPNNLPVQLSNFIGRTREIAHARESIGSARLLTLTGPGGAGKTRLALQVAADLLDEMPDGVWLAEFATLSDAALLPQTVAASLGIREHSERPILSVLTDFLQSRRLLLVFDNCEHVVVECAKVADQLLRACAQLKILATSQTPLGISGEVVLAVPPLSLPDPAEAPSTVDLIQFESVRLFVERAALTKPGFTVTADNAGAVAQIVRQLDGIPLAIELAAARVRMMSVHQIAERLDDRFRLLTAGGRTAAPRQQTLQAAMDWSYDLLTEAERALLRRLSVFGGGWTLEAAEAVCVEGGVEGAQILELLGRLVDRSVVLVRDTERGSNRYHMLETVRQYGQNRLRESGEDRQTRTRHRDWFLILAERAERYLQGADQRAWLDLVEVEHDNLRLALEWSKGADDPEYLLRLAGALWKFWEVRGYWTEGRMWLDGAIEKAATSATSSLVRVMNASAYLASFQGDYGRAVGLGEQSLEMSRKLGDKRGAIACLTILGLEACRLEKYDRAAELGNESLGLSQELGDWWGAVDSRFVLAFVARARGDPQRAATLLEEIVSQVRHVGDRWRLAMALNNLGLVQRELGNYGRAQDVLEETLALTQEIGDKWGIAFARSNLAIVAWYRQDYPRAAQQFAQSLRLRVEVGEKRGIVVSLLGLAAVAIRQGDAERAALLFAGAEALRETIGVPVPPFIRGRVDELLAETRAALGEKRFEDLWQKSRGIALETVIDTALREPSVL